MHKYVKIEQKRQLLCKISTRNVSYLWFVIYMYVKVSICFYNSLHFTLLLVSDYPIVKYKTIQNTRYLCNTITWIKYWHLLANIDFFLFPEFYQIRSNILIEFLENHVSRAKRIMYILEAEWKDACRILSPLINKKKKNKLFIEIHANLITLQNSKIQKFKR